MIHNNATQLSYEDQFQLALAMSLESTENKSDNNVTSAITQSQQELIKKEEAELALALQLSQQQVHEKNLLQFRSQKNPKP